MKVRVRAKNDKFEFEGREGESVLYAGLRNGLVLPYECATGTCGTCKARVREPATIEEGWVEAPGNGYLKRERGEFLMCQTCVLADCEIAVPATVGRAPESATAPVWTQGRVGNLRRLTHDVIAFSLDVDDAMDFEAGQFAVVEVPQVQGFRAYSMVNYARAAKSLEFVVKKKPDGAFSDWLFAADADGAEAAVFGPLGNAIFRPEEDRDVLCIAGGSGIAGMMSILARGCGDGYFKTHKGNLFFGVRTMKDVFFLDELSAFAAAYPDNLRVTIALSDEDVPTAGALANGAVDFANGFVHTVASERMSGRYGDVTAFIAGPPPMVDGAIRMLILDARLPASQVRYDKFS